MDLEALPRFEGEMNFSGPIEGRAAVYVPDWNRTNMNLEPHRLTLYDARPIRSELSLEKQGFNLYDHTGPSTDPEWIKANEAAHTDSVGAFLKEMSGAARVIAQGTGMLVRHVEATRDNGKMGVSRWVHADYTRKWGEVWRDWMEGWHGEDFSRYSRYCIFQTWRQITPSPTNNTLVFCDASSCDQSKLIVFDAVVREPIEEPGNWFESQFSLWDENQRWHYFSDLTPDELIVFKGYDSDERRDAQPLHNSVDLPERPGMIPRISVEARFFAFFD